MAIDTAPTGSGTRSAHPLDALSAAEIETAADVVRADGRLTDAALFAVLSGLDEPSRKWLRPSPPATPLTGGCGS